MTCTAAAIHHLTIGWHKCADTVTSSVIQSHEGALSLIKTVAQPTHVVLTKDQSLKELLFAFSSCPNRVN